MSYREANLALSRSFVFNREEASVICDISPLRSKDIAFCLRLKPFESILAAYEIV